MKFARYGRGILCRCLTLLLVLGVGVASAAVSAVAQSKPESVTIGYLNLVNAQLISKALGLHEKAFGVPVKWVRFDTGGQVNAAFAAGQLDFGSMGNPPAVAGVTRGLPYEAVVVLNMLEGVEGLVVKAGRGIATPKDLVGKRLAMPFGSTAYYIAMSLLRDSKIDAKAVTLVDLNPAAAFEAWQRDEIDAAYVWEPALDKMVKAGGIILVDSKEMAGRGLATWDISAVTTKFSGAHPDLVAAFVKSECEAIDYFIKRPREAADLIAKELALTVEDAARMMKGTGMIPCPEQTGAAYFGTPDAKGRFVDSLVDIATFFKEMGRMAEIKDRSAYAAFINPAYLLKSAGR